MRSGKRNNWNRRVGLWRAAGYTKDGFVDRFFVRCRQRLARFWFQSPAAKFVNSVQSDKLLFLSYTAGPAWVGKGKVGKDLTVEQGREAARQAGLIMLTKIRTALGSLDRVKRVVKVLGMVNSADGFGDQRL